MIRAARAFKVERSHRRGCYAFASAAAEGGGPFFTLAETDATGQRRDPFVFCNRYANPKVRIGKHQPYLRFRCNDMKCPATALVHIDTALRAIGLNRDVPARRA